MLCTAIFLGLIKIMNKSIFLTGIFCTSLLFLISACNNTLSMSVYPCTKKDLTGKIWQMYKFSEPPVKGQTIPKDDIFLFTNQYRLFYEDNSARHISSTKPIYKEIFNSYLKMPSSLVYKINNQGEVSISADYGNAPPYKVFCSYIKTGNKENISLKFNNPEGEVVLVQDFFATDAVL